MKLQRIKLENIGHFAQLNINFAPSQQHAAVTIIFGDQNTGKTTLLKHIFQGLSWFAHRHKDLRATGIVIADADIKTDTPAAHLFMEVRYPHDLGHILDEAYTQSRPEYTCRWKIEKKQHTAGSLNLGTSQLAELDQLAQRYQQHIQYDPLFSTPCIAYYPVERFIYEVNIQGKNIVSTLSPMHNAYDLTVVNFTTFNKFFEWFREVHDLENAQAAKLFKQYLDPQLRFTQQQDFDAAWASIEQAYRLSSQRCMSSVRTALKTVLPEIQDISLEYSPKLALMVKHQAQWMPVLQLPQSSRIWVGLVGDIVRRLCLLNPHSLYPCLEGEGIILIDAIDLLLDQPHLQQILPRLRRAFPRLQFIVSSQSHDLLEDIQNTQCFQLINQSIIPLPMSQHQLGLKKIYETKWQSLDKSHLDTAHMGSPILPEAQPSAEPPVTPTQQILHLAQQLTPTELNQIIDQLQQQPKEN